ncbi:sugar transferase [Clostridium sp. D53t1_180928_C8]|uniref:sugar transferase n=1 Tax=Clostridium sp. D53t1_180928_C8 TaxID=2787101 RepID=UPI0018AA09F2|nr:sugar transferase [Clostridium sp. D53t1_180928_C8]
MEALVQSSNEIIEISKGNKILKRSFDIIIGSIGLVIALPIILISALLFRICYGESGFFTQVRVGKDGKKFKIFKIKSMSSKIKYDTTVTTEHDPRITKLGKLFRKTKIDELPQLINVVKGEMSFVGPRPDVEEVINTLSPIEKKVYLSVRPGITGPASIKYKNEEEILAKVSNPERYSIEVIFRDKVYINSQYINEYSFLKDIKYIVDTVL